MDPGVSDRESNDARRTHLAAERTWLAWWRTGIATTATAVAIGAVIPRLAGGPRWPYILLGACYAILAVVVFLIAGHRQRMIERTIYEGGGSGALSPGIVTVLSFIGSFLAISTIVVILIRL
jgi:putative membrane protein